MHQSLGQKKSIHIYQPASFPSPTYCHCMYVRNNEAVSATSNIFDCLVEFAEQYCDR